MDEHEDSVTFQANLFHDLESEEKLILDLKREEKDIIFRIEKEAQSKLHEEAVQIQRTELAQKLITDKSNYDADIELKKSLKAAAIAEKREIFLENQEAKKWPVVHQQETQKFDIQYQELLKDYEKSLSERNRASKKLHRAAQDQNWDTLRSDKKESADHQKISQIQEIKDQVTIKYKDQLEDLKREATHIKHNLKILKNLTPDDLNLNFEILETAEEDAQSSGSWNSDSQLVDRIRGKETKIKKLKAKEREVMWKIENDGLAKDRKNSEAAEMEELREKIGRDKSDSDMRAVSGKNGRAGINDEKMQGFRELQDAKLAQKKIFDDDSKYKIEYTSLLDDYEKQMNSKAEEKATLVSEQVQKWALERDYKKNRDQETLMSQVQTFKDHWTSKNQFRLKKKQRERADLEKTVGFLRNLTGGLK